MPQLTKHEKVKKAIIAIFKNKGGKFDVNTLATKIPLVIEEYEDTALDTTRRAVNRALRSLMEDYPGSFGFYASDDSIFYTLKIDDDYDDFIADFNLKNRQYHMKDNTGIANFEQAMYELLQGHLGNNEIKKLLDGVELSRNYDLKPDHELYFDLASRIEISPRYQPLYPPNIHKDSFVKILSSLLHEISFTGRYLLGNKTRFWPVRLIVQGRVMYVLCKTHDHKSQYHEYALHRFSEIENDLKKAHNENDLLNLKENDLDLVYDREAIEEERKRPIEPDPDNPIIEVLELKFYGSPAQHMSEVRFHLKINDIENETVCIKKGAAESGKKIDYCHIRAKNIKNDYNLKTWLLGFGQQVEVVKPDKLKEDLIKELEGALKHYSGYYSRGTK